MVNLRLQKRLASSILKCGKRKIWLDPNEMNEIGMSNTRTSVRKLVRDGFIIKKPMKVHSRFRARRRAIEKKKGRHLGMGCRKGTRNARNPVKTLWMQRQRAARRLLRRYRQSQKIDKKMYHRLYMKAKGGGYKNKANLIDNIELELAEKARTRALLQQYKARQQAQRQTRADREQEYKKKKAEQLKLAEEAEKMIEQQRLREKQAAQQLAAKKKTQDAQKGKQQGKGAGAAKGKGAAPAAAGKAGKAGAAAPAKAAAGKGAGKGAAAAPAKGADKPKSGGAAKQQPKQDDQGRRRRKR